MIYGYARVSTVAQDLANQLAQLKAAGCGQVFREKITGTTADRPQLKKMIAVLASGDVVITPAVDRLSRDTTDLMVIARDIQRAGAGLPPALPLCLPSLPSLDLLSVPLNAVLPPAAGLNCSCKQ
jgi:DNA invertase Pin-like site-specific DNA recombinase